MHPRIGHAKAILCRANPYLSISCRIGTHRTCTETSLPAAPVDIPVVYEACDCSCHTAVDRNAPTEVAP